MGILILEKEVYTKWVNENICYDLNEDKFVTLEERSQIVKNDFLLEGDFEDFTEEEIEDEIENYVEDEIEYTTKSGDKIVVISVDNDYY